MEGSPLYDEAGKRVIGAVAGEGFLKHSAKDFFAESEGGFWEDDGSGGGGATGGLSPSPIVSHALSCESATRNDPQRPRSKIHVRRCHVLIDHRLLGSSKEQV